MVFSLGPSGGTEGVSVAVVTVSTDFESVDFWSLGDPTFDFDPFFTFCSTISEK